MGSAAFEQGVDVAEKLRRVGEPHVVGGHQPAVLSGDGRQPTRRPGHGAIAKRSFDDQQADGSALGVTLFHEAAGRGVGLAEDVAHAVPRGCVQPAGVRDRLPEVASGIEGGLGRPAAQVFAEPEIVIYLCQPLPFGRVVVALALIATGVGEAGCGQEVDGALKASDDA